MEVEFIAADPGERARPVLDDVMQHGVDQLAIACAFCTAAGVELLLRHTARLANSSSFVVVASAPPTDYSDLLRLHKVVPSSLFVHWGALAPVEKKNGAALMHSKVFYARAGQRCWLWTGSHNLTGNATQGGNCEAAVLLRGTVNEKPFVDALKHLVACRDEAIPYDPELLPPSRAERTDILVIHAEASPPAPSGPLPWHIHLCLETAEFDHLLTAAGNVRLFLYPKGSLVRGWQNATPSAAYSGSLTGLNLTARNPRARGAGTTAEWRAANFGIYEVANALVLGPIAPTSNSVTTQAVLSINAQSAPNETLFSEKPQIATKMIAGEPHWTPLDPDMRRFFQKGHRKGSSMLHLPIVDREKHILIPANELRMSDFGKIRKEIAGNRELPFDFAEASDAKKRHPFIIRAKYRLPDDT